MACLRVKEVWVELWGLWRVKGVCVWRGWLHGVGNMPLVAVSVVVAAAAAITAAACCN